MSNWGFRIRHSLVRVLIVLFCLLLFYNVFILIDSDPLFMRWKCTIINRALSLIFSRLGFEGLAALAIGFMVRALFSAADGGLSFGSSVIPHGAAESTSSEGPNLGGRNLRWTDLFGSDYTSSSEASVNQPDSPNPSEPPAPATEYNPLLGDGQRRQELKDRLAINLVGNTLGVRENDILDTQYEIEIRIEKALRWDRFSDNSLIESRHRIRGVLFYPYGRPLSLNTYQRHLQFMDNYGTHHSVPYKRVMDAVYSKYSINLNKG
jgi:hypothetical protein